MAQIVYSVDFYQTTSPQHVLRSLNPLLGSRCLRICVLIMSMIRAKQRCKTCTENVKTIRMQKHMEMLRALGVEA